MLQLNNVRLAPDQKVIRARDYQAYLDAEALLAAARAEADRIVAAAREEFTAQQQLGYQQGLIEGRMEMAERMIDSVSRSVDYFSTMEGQIVEIVMKALRKILGEMDLRDRTVSTVRNALSLARHQSKVHVRVHPTEVQVVQERIQEITRPYPGVQFLDVVADARLDPGGCILESDVGVVDASIEVQLKAIEKSLVKSVGEHGGGGAS